MHRTGAARPRPLVRRRPAARARRRAAPISSARWTADLSHDPEYLPDLVAAAADARPRHRIALPERRRQRRELAAAPDLPQRVRATATSASSPGCRRSDCTSGYPLLAARRAGAAADRQRWCPTATRSSTEMLYEAKRRGFRIGEVPIIFVERRIGQSKLSSSVLIESLIMPWRLRLRPARPLPPAAARAPDMRHVVVMVTTSYPRFPGDSVGTFMEPIAKHVAARGHEVHIVAPWHPRITRGKVEDGVFFHFFKYAPVAGAERLRLRRGPARGRAAEGRRVDGRAAGDDGRAGSRRCASRRRSAPP